MFPSTFSFFFLFLSSSFPSSSAYRNPDRATVSVHWHPWRRRHALRAIDRIASLVVNNAAGTGTSTTSSSTAVAGMYLAPLAMDNSLSLDSAISIATPNRGLRRL